MRLAEHKNMPLCRLSLSLGDRKGNGDGKTVRREIQIRSGISDYHSSRLFVCLPGDPVGGQRYDKK